MRKPVTIEVSSNILNEAKALAKLENLTFSQYIENLCAKEIEATLAAESFKPVIESAPLISMPKEEALALVKQNPILLNTLSLELRDDFDLVLAAVTITGRVIEYASDRLRQDKTIVLRAMVDSHSYFRFAHANLRNDKDFVLDVVTHRGSALEHVSPKLKNDKDVVLAAVSQHGFALYYASSKLQNDRDVVLAAINNRGHELKYASEELQNDKEVVLKAVIQNGAALAFASKELQNDKEVVLVAVGQDEGAISHASHTLQCDLDVLRLLFCGRSKYAIDNCHESIRYTQTVLFLKDYNTRIHDNDWPVVKRALLEKPDYFLNPEPYMKALADGMEYPYLMLAQYALSKDFIIDSHELPTIEF